MISSDLFSDGLVCFVHGNAHWLSEPFPPIDEPYLQRNI